MGRRLSPGLERGREQTLRHHRAGTRLRRPIFLQHFDVVSAKQRPPRINLVRRSRGERRQPHPASGFAGHRFATAVDTRCVPFLAHDTLQCVQHSIDSLSRPSPSLERSSGGASNDPSLSRRSPSQVVDTLRRTWGADSPNEPFARSARTRPPQPPAARVWARSRPEPWLRRWRPSCAWGGLRLFTCTHEGRLSAWRPMFSAAAQAKSEASGAASRCATRPHANGAPRTPAALWTQTSRTPRQGGPSVPRAPLRPRWQTPARNDPA